MQLSHKSTKKASFSYHFCFIAFILLSVRFGSAQMALPTPDPASGQTGGSGVAIFLSAFGVIVGLLIIAVMISVLRSRRNPERYGPSPARPGRPKQSRAKGLARAVLESIPIVRFSESDKDANATPQRDIELAVTGLDIHTPSTTVDASSLSPDPDAIFHSNRSTNTPATTTEGLLAAQPTFQTRSGSLECSICLEKFVENEEIRVLPCNHKFHPVCIDPWLLNVSGTCPLCRYDLHPATTDDFNTAATSTNEPLPPPPPPPYEVSDNTPARSRFRELRRVHAGPEEYIAALRQLYHEFENHRVSHVSTSIEAAAHQDSRPTSRLRDTFHMQTGPSESHQTLPDDVIRALSLPSRII